MEVALGFGVAVGFGFGVAVDAAVAAAVATCCAVVAWAMFPLPVAVVAVLVLCAVALPPLSAEANVLHEQQAQTSRTAAVESAIPNCHPCDKRRNRCQRLGFGGAPTKRGMPCQVGAVGDGGIEGNGGRIAG